MIDTNPWAERFAKINSIDIIKKLSARPAVPLKDLDKDPTRVACDKIEMELEEIFVPTQRSCEILLELIEMGLSHAQQFYSGKRAFITRIYKTQMDFAPRKPIMLTGLPGVGKSQLIKALIRMLGSESTIKVDADHAPFPLVPVRRIVINDSQKSITAVLRPLSGVDLNSNEAKKFSWKLQESCMRWQYQSGTSLIVVDELQFFTQSDNATVLVASLALQFSYLGIPNVIACNYSLLHRLMRRPSAERQRILADPIALIPDHFDSEDWELVLKEYKTALPGIFGFCFIKYKQEMWSYCAGIKRELVKLLILAYKQNRRKGLVTVSWEDLQKAYKSFEFTAAREDIELLISDQAENNKLKLDLWCPLALPLAMTNAYTKALSESRTNQVAEAAADASLSQDERRKLVTYASEIKKSISQNKPTLRGAGRTGKIDAQMLKANAKRAGKNN